MDIETCWSFQIRTRPGLGPEINSLLGPSSGSDPRIYILLCPGPYLILTQIKFGLRFKLGMQQFQLTGYQFKLGRPVRTG